MNVCQRCGGQMLRSWADEERSCLQCGRIEIPGTDVSLPRAHAAGTHKPWFGPKVDRPRLRKRGVKMGKSNAGR